MVPVWCKTYGHCREGFNQKMQAVAARLWPKALASWAELALGCGQGKNTQMNSKQTVLECSSIRQAQKYEP